MWEDPIVAEVHRIRDQIMASFNHDIDVYVADLMKRQVELGDTIVRVKKRMEPAVSVERGQGFIASDSTPVDAVPVT